MSDYEIEMIYERVARERRRVRALRRLAQLKRGNRSYSGRA